MPFRFTFVAALTLCLACGGATQAQDRATIQAVATVVSTLSVIGSNNLQFGTVTPGVSKAVDKTSIGFAGEWTVTGVGAAEVAVDFTLPTVLCTIDGLSTIPITFGAVDASYGDAPADQSSPVGVMNPNGPSAHRIGSGGQMLVWIGGAVHPRISQTGGNYSAVIMLTVAYTGS